MPTLETTVRRLSNHQRALLVAHYNGLHPFHNEPIENTTRRSLVIRGLIRYEPRMPGRLGKPQGTVLTDPNGREACCMVLGEMADQLSNAYEAAEWRKALDVERQDTYRELWAECTRHWHRYGG